MDIGTKVRINKTKVGCLGAKGLVGFITNEEHTSGLLGHEKGYNVKVASGAVWRINLDADVTILNNDYDPIVRVIFNNPATVVIWCDGTKTVVKCQPGEKFDKEKGLAMCIAKKHLGNKNSYYDIFKLFMEE